MTEALASPPVTLLPAATSRTAWIDAAKAFAIFFVVFGHVLRGAYDTGLLAHDALFRWIDNSIYLFHMPLFFFLSGLTFTGQKLAWTDFLRRRLRGIVLPYVIWSTALVAIKQLGQGSVNHPVGFADLLAIAYAPISPFWFFYALLLIQIATRLTMPRVGANGVLALSVLAFLGHFLNPDQGTPIDSGLEFFLYFAIGLVLQPLRSLRIGGAAASAAALLFLVPPLLCVLGQIDYQTLPGRLAAVPMILAASGFFIWLGGTAAGRAWPIRMAGQATLEIYCLHIFFTGTTRIVLLRLGLADPGVQLVAGTLLGMALPIAIARAATHLGLSGWLGFPPLNASRKLRPPG